MVGAELSPKWNSSHSIQLPVPQHHRRPATPPPPGFLSPVAVATFGFFILWLAASAKGRGRSPRTTKATPGYSCFDRTMEAELLPKWNGGHSVPLLFDPCATPATVPYDTSSFGAFSFPDSSNKLSETCRTTSTRLSLSRDHAALRGEAPTLVVLVAGRSSSDLRRWSHSEVQIEAEHEPSCTRCLRIPVVMLDSWRGEGGNDGDDLDQAGLGLRNTDADRMSRTNRHGRNRDSMWHNKNYLNSLVGNTTILHIVLYIYIIDYPFAFFLLFSVPSMHL